jgi:hypothetical protein
VARSKQLDVDSLLTKLERWVTKQPKEMVRLVKGKPMSDTQIDRIPSQLKQFSLPLPTAYDPKRFVIPAGYRDLLRRCGGVRLEVRETDDDKFAPYGPFHIFRPGSCAKAHSGDGPTLCDSWSVAGTTVNDRDITTTELVSFASMGYAVEASRWCFYLGGTGTLAIYEESNDYECLAGRYVDDGTPLSKTYQPVFTSFDRWFEATIAVITKQPLDLDQPATVTKAIYERGR